ncbi:MAG: oxidoreductase [Flavobacteriales bacterium]|nr:MAG: oxidoreductase [Flavobacteriales bacterium]
MKQVKIKFIFLLVTFILIIQCKKKPDQRAIQLSFEEITVPNSSIRAIYPLKDSTLFYATSDGYMGMVLPNMKNVKDKRIFYDTITPHFRAIASNGTNIFILSVGNPALLYKLNDGELELVYKEKHEKVFYDAMAFFDEKHGIAMGDPTDGCLSVILTEDGGNTWKKIPCVKLPETVEGEAAFAASNSNIAIYKDRVWMVTGGKKSRVFRSVNRGKNWQVFDTPIISGGEMTGIYSIDFYDKKHGIIIGGDWNNKTMNTGNKAITKNGGKTWELVQDGREPGYKSCVQYVPDTGGQEVFAVGTTGISFSNNGGITWKKLSDKSYFTIRFVNKNMAWLAGDQKIAKMVIE